MNYVEAITDQRKIQSMSAYLKQRNERDYVMFILGINIGLRISDMLDKKVGFFREAAKLGYVELAPKKQDKSAARQIERAKGKGIVATWNNDSIGIEEEAVVINSSGRRKIVRIYMSDEIRRFIIEETKDMQDEQFMFASRQGDGPITRQMAYVVLNDAAKSAGIQDKIGTHSMRKTFGYWHYQKNHDIRLLMDIFGHSSEDITLKYIGITNEAKKASAKGMMLGL